jgi:uncharacterized lipoprotein YmbA
MRPWLTGSIVCTALAALVGCASTQPSRFYVLSDLRSMETAPQAAAAGQDLAVGIGPITVPKYLDRPQIATLASRHELNFAEFDRWAEPLDVTLARALAGHLSTLIPTEHVAVYPWARGAPIDYQVTVEVTHFVGQVGGAGVLMASWSIAQAEGGAPVVSRRSRFTAQAAGQGYEAVVAAMSQTVAELGREIAETINGLASRARAR